MKYSIYVVGSVLPNGAIFDSRPKSGTADALGSTYRVSVTGFNVRKYMNKEDINESSNSGINFILIRYAEVLLTYAEAADDKSYHITYPVAQYDHDEGKAIPQLKGKYLFGDIPTGRLFYVDIADIQQGKQAIIREWNISINGHLTTLAWLHEHGRVYLHFGRDAGDKYIY